MGQARWLARDNPETNPITINPETLSHVAEQFSWVPLPYCSLPGRPFPINSFALSARVSPRTVHLWVLDKSPLSGPGRGPSSCNTRINNFLELLIELRKAVELLLSVYYKGYNSGTAKWKRCTGQSGGRGRRELPCPLQGCYLLSTLKCSPAWKHSKLCCVGVFMEVSLQRHD